MSIYHVNRNRARAVSQACLASFLISVAGANANLSEGLKLHYTFDNDNAAVIDSSGNGNNGSRYGGVGYVPGLKGQAAYFSNRATYIASDSAALNMDGWSGLTVSVWVCPTAYTSYGHIINRCGVTDTTAGAFQLYAGRLYGHGAFAVSTNDGAYVGKFVGEQPALSLNTWHHLVGTFDGHEVRYYYDGILAARTVLGGAGCLLNDPSNTKLVIGTVYPSLNWYDLYFHGYVDEVRIYDRGLASNEVAALSSTVFDTTPPEIYLLGDNPQFVEFGGTYQEMYAMAFDDIEGDLSDFVSIDSEAVNPYALGTYPVTYDVSDSAGNAAAQEVRFVTVRDTTAPVIRLIGSTNMVLEAYVDVYRELGARVFDAASSNLGVNIGGYVNTRRPGTYVVTYDAVDMSGNRAEQKVRLVTVRDTIAPVITLNGSPDIALQAYVDAYAEPGASVFDASGTNVCVVIGGDQVDTERVGTYVVTYNAVDSSGNRAVEKMRTVVVLAQQDVKAQVLDQLIALKAVVTGGDVQKVANGIDFVSACLAPDLWETKCTLSTNGEKVFNYEAAAVAQLQSIAQAAPIIAKMVTVDAGLAKVSLINAGKTLATLTDPKQVAQAQQKIGQAESSMLKAEEDFAAGQIIQSIEHYKQAWHFVSGLK